MIRASIDIGSNSVLLLIAELDGSGQKIIREIVNSSHITSLGKSLDKTKMFHPDSMQATYNALLDYKSELEKLNLKPEIAIVTATEAARVANNSSDFFSKIKNELGFEIKIISSDKEAYYTALGVATGSVEEKSVVIMDIGGASTELIKVELKPFKIINSISLPIGAMRAADWESESIFQEKASEIFSQNFDFYKTDSLVCVAGGMTAIGAIYLKLQMFDAAKVDKMHISFSEFKLLAKTLHDTSPESLLIKYPFLGKRAQVIASAARVAEMFGESLEVKDIKISTRGLRYGTILKGLAND